MAKITMAIADTKITAADIAALNSQDDATLAKWWCELNRWNWPVGLPDEESRGENTRRTDLMQWIKAKIGIRECLREWNIKS